MKTGSSDRGSAGAQAGARAAGRRREAGVVALEGALGAVAGAHQRPRDDLEETLVETQLPVGRELVRVDELADGQVIGGGPQVLAEGEQVDAGCAQVVHRLRHFARRSRPGPA